MSTLEDLEEEEAKLQALIDKRQENIDSIRAEAAAIKESHAARKEALLEELAASEEVKDQMLERSELMGQIATMQENFNNLTAFEKDLLRDKRNALGKIEMANREIVDVMKEIENSAAGAEARARQQEGSLSIQKAKQEKIRDLMNKQKEDLAKLKDLQDKINIGADLMGTMFGGINSRLDSAISGTADFAIGLATAIVAGNKLEFALKSAKKAMSALVSMTNTLSEILATGVKESGLVEFESMLYANAGATNQFGLDAEKTGELLAGLNGDMTGFALISADMQNKLIEQAAALDALGVSAGESGKLFEELSRGQGMNAEQIDKTIDGFTNLGRSIGKSTKDVVSDFNRMSESLSQFGDESTEVFKKVMEASARLGVSADQFDKLYRSTTTFSGAADMAGKLNGVLGTTVDAMELINSENPAETMDILRDSLLAQGKSWANLSVQQRRFLADTLGMPMGEIKKMLSGEDLPPKSPAQIQMESLSKTAMDLGKIIDVQFNKLFNKLAESGVLKKIQNSITEIFGEGGSFSFFMDQIQPGVLAFAKIFKGAFLVIAPIVKGMFYIFGGIARILGEVVGFLVKMQEIFPFLEMIAGGMLARYLAINAAMITQGALLVALKIKAGLLAAIDMARAIPGIMASFAAIPFGLGMPLAGAVIAGMMGLYARYADDFASKPSGGGGYGDRVLMDKGEMIAFNNDDTIIAGTNIELANDATIAPAAKGGAKAEQMLPVKQETNNTTSEVGMSERVMYDKGELTTVNNNERLVAGTNLQLANDAVSAAVTQRRTNDAETKTKPAEKKETTAPASQGGDRQPIILKFDEITLGQVIARLNEKNQAIVSA